MYHVYSNIDVCELLFFFRAILPQLTQAISSVIPIIFQGQSQF